MNMLGVVDDADVYEPTLTAMLTSSMLVTGALLVGTGDCRVVGNTIGVNVSVQTTSVGKWSS